MKERVITAFIMLAIVATFLWLGGLPFTIFISVVLAIAGYEWCRLFLKGGYSPNTVFVVVGILAYVTVSLIDLANIYPIFLLLYILLALLLAFQSFQANKEKAMMNLFIQLSGVFYIAQFGLSFIRTRNLPDGGWWLFFLIALTAIGDTAALFIGKPWGKHKLGNGVSPNKSWEGVIAGGIAAGLTGLAFSLLAGDWFLLEPLWSVLFASAVYLVSIVGDLTISMIKRWAGEKDSGTLFPGHGGMLDRIDSHLWSATLGYHLLIWYVLVQ